MRGTAASCKSSSSALSSWTAACSSGTGPQSAAGRRRRPSSCRPTARQAAEPGVERPLPRTRATPPEAARSSSTTSGSGRCSLSGTRRKHGCTGTPMRTSPPGSSRPPPSRRATSRTSSAGTRLEAGASSSGTGRRLIWRPTSGTSTLDRTLTTTAYCLRRGLSSGLSFAHWRRRRAPSWRPGLADSGAWAWTCSWTRIAPSGSSSSTSCGTSMG
mmetsp:Transcript_92195/g.275007  ORF Transcript_92195/g.275007 Transcript_92195/m.275007 type:complete len:215 (+) Transcript_92195:268-912(+)